METTTPTATRSESFDLVNADLREERMARMTPERRILYHRIAERREEAGGVNTTSCVAEGAARQWLTSSWLTPRSSRNGFSKTNSRSTLTWPTACSIVLLAGDADLHAEDVTI